MKTTRIGNKTYIMVHERILEFHNLYPNGRIETELCSFNAEAGVVLIKATVVPDVGASERFFTGHAFEFRDDTKSMVNKASYVENGETSAVGRALGQLGIGIEDGFASADEVINKKDRSHTPSAGTTDDLCLKCGAPMKMSKQGKSYCSAICWDKKKAPTGPIPEPDTSDMAF